MPMFRVPSPARSDPDVSRAQHGPVMVDHCLPVRDARKLLPFDMGGVPHWAAFPGLLLGASGGYPHDSCDILYIGHLW